jgi:uncharacterized membrane protein
VSGTALALVLGAAVAHAVWNLFFKQASGGFVFTWLATVAAAALYTPVGVVELFRGEGNAEICALAAAGGVIHVVYLLALQRAYRDGDLSHVYPLSRGFGAMVAALGAVVIFSERPSLLASLGVALILAAVLALAVSGTGPGAASGWPLITGVTIAAYTLWDKNAVDDFARSPLLYFWLVLIAMSALMGARAHRELAGWRKVWIAERRAVLAFGILGPVAYTLVLLGLALSPASYVAPVRETSVVVAAVLGSVVLGEEAGVQRALAAAAVVAGVVAVALG